MGNSNNRCCDIKEEKKSHSSNPKLDRENYCKESTTFSIRSKNTDTADLTNGEAKSSDKSCETEQDPKPDIFATPICAACRRVISCQNENALQDPRSPTNGIDRTPLCLSENATFANVEDPRSPSVGIVRTPIVKLEQSSSVPNSNVVVRNLHDPRSPTVELFRTPLKLSENLRRSVLLTNTLMTSPNSSMLKGNAEKLATSNLETSTNSSVSSEEANEMESLKSDNVLNFSCSTNSGSLSSSMVANVDSGSLNFSKQESLHEDNLQEIVTEPSVFQDFHQEIVQDVVGSLVMEVCSSEQPTEYNTFESATDNAIEKQSHLLKSSDEPLAETFSFQDPSRENANGRQNKSITGPKKSLIPSALKKSTENVRQKRSLSSEHPKSLNAAADSQSSANLNTGENIEETSSLFNYSKLRCIQDKSSTVVQTKLKENINKPTLTQSVRSPLAVLRNNSPTAFGFNRDGKSGESKKSQSITQRNTCRVPRYKGNNALLRSKTVGLLPSSGLSENSLVKPSHSRQISRGKEN